MKFLMLLSFFAFLALGVQAGEIQGEVVLSSQTSARAKNSNPNRKATVKKYGLKELQKAQAGGDGGLSPNEVIDERDYTVIYLAQAKDGSKLKATPRTVEVVQRKRRFHEHVTPLPLGSKVKFVNNDNYYHHIYCPDSSKINVPEHRGDVERKPDSLGKFELFCDIHPLMNAYLFVVPNDQFTVPKGGRFSLKNVPPGQYVLKAWHPRLSEKSYEVTVPASGAGKVNVTL